MSKRVGTSRKSWLAGMGCLALLAAAAAGDDNSRPEPLAQQAVAVTKVANPAALPRDYSKTAVIEPSALNLVAKGSANSTADNPKVAAGKVKWHASFAEACAAASKSGKPVLLFQMMGQLDDLFC
jgi:hypothetical protein